MEPRARELFEHGLKDMYDAEHRFEEGLREMMRVATDETLRNSLERHRDVTRRQIERLERVFRDMGSRPQRERCKGAEGLVEEFRSFMKDRPDRDTVNAFIPMAALKVEHYEIASYKSLVETGRLVDVDVDPLEANLDEEQRTARELEGMGLAMFGKLAGVAVGNLIQRTASTVGELFREGAKMAVGAADVVRERASDAVDRAETRGRRATGAKRSSAGRRPSGRGTRKSSGGRSTTRRSSTSGRKTTARRKTSSGGTRRSSSTARRSTTGRKTTGRKTTGRKTATRKTTGTRKAASTRRTSAGAKRSSRPKSTTRRATRPRSTTRRGTSSRGGGRRTAATRRR